MQLVDITFVAEELACFFPMFNLKKGEKEKGELFYC
jgi:hypothetical protein